MYNLYDFLVQGLCSDKMCAMIFDGFSDKDLYEFYQLRLASSFTTVIYMHGKKVWSIILTTVIQQIFL